MQSAYIGAETTKKDAQAFAESAIPQAQAEADSCSPDRAGRRAASDLARARGDAEAFLALDKEYRANPAVVRERLYRDAVEQAIGVAGTVRWVPPPVGGSYTDSASPSLPTGSATLKSLRGRTDEEDDDER